MNFCPTCNKEIRINQKYCNSSCFATRNNKMRAKRTLESRQKTSKALKGRIRNIEIYASRPCEVCKKEFIPTQQDKKNPYNGILKSKRFCSYECKNINQSKVLSLALKGKSGGPRKGAGRSKGSYYKDFWMDSTWEVAFAKRLDELSVKWERNINKYSFSYTNINDENRRYFPDFYLTNYDLFVEIKGFWTKEVRHKMNDVVSTNKDLKLLIIDDIEIIENFNISLLNEYTFHAGVD